MRYTLRIEAQINGRSTASYEIDVESIQILQALIDAAQDAMEVVLLDVAAGSEDRVATEPAGEPSL